MSDSEESRGQGTTNTSGNPWGVSMKSTEPEERLASAPQPSHDAEIEVRKQCEYLSQKWAECGHLKLAHAEHALRELAKALAASPAPSQPKFAIGRRVKWRGQIGECSGVVKQITHPENSGYVYWIDIGVDEDMPHGENNLELVEQMICGCIGNCVGHKHMPPMTLTSPGPETEPRLSKWQILVDNIPANAPVIGMDHEYWGFTIFRGTEQDSVFTGSADDLPTCLSMAQEGFEIVSGETFPTPTITCTPASEPAGEMPPLACPKCGHNSVNAHHGVNAPLADWAECQPPGCGYRGSVSEFFSSPRVAPCLGNCNPKMEAAWCHDCLAQAVKSASSCVAETSLSPSIESTISAAFKIEKANLNCFKLYFFGSFLGSHQTEKQAMQRARLLASHMYKWAMPWIVDAEAANVYCKDVAELSRELETQTGVAPRVDRPEVDVEAAALLAAKEILYPDGKPLEGYGEEDVTEVAKIIVRHLAGGSTATPANAGCSEFNHPRRPETDKCFCGQETFAGGEPQEGQ